MHQEHFKRLIHTDFNDPLGVLGVMAVRSSVWREFFINLLGVPTAPAIGVVLGCRPAFREDSSTMVEPAKDLFIGAELRRMVWEVMEMTAREEQRSFTDLSVPGDYLVRVWVFRLAGILYPIRWFAMFTTRES